MTRVGIVAALESEAHHLHPRVRRGQVVNLGDDTLLCVSGMGAAAAEQAARALREAGARSLASFGFAGALDPALVAGTILLPERVLASGRAAIATHSDWRRQLAVALQRANPRGGALLSADAALATARNKAEAFAATGALAVDMESSAVGQVASGCNCPFLVVRVILDEASDAIPEALAAAAHGSGRMRITTTIARVVCSPRDLRAFWRLLWRYRIAQRSLALVARSKALSARSAPTPAGRTPA